MNRKMIRRMVKVMAIKRKITPKEVTRKKRRNRKNRITNQLNKPTKMNPMNL